MINWALLSQIQVKYVEDIIVTRYTANLDMLRKEVIKVVLDTVQENYYVIAYNHLDYLVW